MALPLTLSTGQDTLAHPPSQAQDCALGSRQSEEGKQIGERGDSHLEAASPSFGSSATIGFLR